MLEKTWRVRGGRECRFCGEMRIDYMRPRKGRVGGLDTICRGCNRKAAHPNGQSEGYRRNIEKRRTYDAAYRAAKRVAPERPAPPGISAAIRDSDWGSLIQLIGARTTIQPNGCHLWEGAINSRGYGTVGFRRGSKSARMVVHRIMASVVEQRWIDPFEPVHHKCGVRHCVASEHLQVVTPEANTAEMLERNHYLSRISALEAELKRLDPSSQLLSA